MKKAILTVITAVGLLFASCSDFGDTQIPVVDSQTAEEYTGVQKQIMINVMASRFGGYDISKPNTRALNEFTMTPYIEDGDTLMYIVQYAEGFEVYSAKLCTEKILFSSDTGKFDINDSDMPPALLSLIKSTAKEIKEASEVLGEYVDPSWGAAGLTKAEIDEGDKKIDWNKIKTSNISTLSVQDDPWGPDDNDKELGQWVLLSMEFVGDEDYVSDKLIKTKWHQEDPWNIYAKKKNGESCKAGCAPVAVAQYMYYTHYKEGIPKFTVSKATPNSSGSDFSFTGSSETIWDTMARQSYEWSTDSAALLIGHVGREMSTDYGLNDSSTKGSKVKDYLNKIYYNEFFFIDFDWSMIKRALAKNYPVLCYAEDSRYDWGHLFIIDQFSSHTSTWHYVYGWEGPYWMNGEYVDTNERDEEGNIIGWGIINEIDKVTESNEISMNWGGGGYYDSVWYTIYNEWSVGDYKFNKNKKFYGRYDVNL